MKSMFVRVLPASLTTVLLALLTGPAWAQYKVVAPDGSVTYTDRPPFERNLRITPIGRSATGPAAADPGLPIELRQAVQRYPVVLFTTAECAPCDSGRKLLQQRGVPYVERSIGSEEDVQALERLVGSRTVPALSVGAQPLRGFSDTDWASYLDAAGYPKESKLPRNWPVPVAAPLVERAAAAAPTARPAAPAAEPRVPDAPQPGTIRF